MPRERGESRQAIVQPKNTVYCLFFKKDKQMINIIVSKVKKGSGDCVVHSPRYKCWYRNKKIRDDRPEAMLQHRVTDSVDL